MSTENAARADAAALPDGAPTGLTIRPGRPSDHAALAAIEHRADQLFAQHGYPAIAAEPPGTAEEFAAATGERLLMVAVLGGQPVGHAVAGEIAGHWHLSQLAVDPAFGQRGIGTTLVGSVLAAGRERGLSLASLTTFRDVPFNAPFYARLGFRELALSRAPAALVARFAAEVPPGVRNAERVLMVRAL